MFSSSGRGGLGVPTAAKKPRPLPPAVLAAAQAAAASAPLADVNLYLARNSSSHDENRCKGSLRALRKTCEELDRRNGIEESVMWREPESLEREAREERRRLAYKGTDHELEEERIQVADKGDLRYATGINQVVVDDEEETELHNKAEEEEWFSKDVRLP